MKLNSYTYYLFDFAEVISLPQDMECFFQMSHLLKMDEKQFHEAYWKHRKPYDRGDKGNGYWEKVAGRKLEESLIQELIRLDCNSWGRMNPWTIDFIEELKKMGKRVGLLSNLPIDLVHYIRDFYFISLMDDIFFSAEIQMVKPDVEIYQHVLDKIKVPANEVLFFDDKEENLVGARKAGLNTWFFTPESYKELKI